MSPAKMEPLSRIANCGLLEITDRRFGTLPRLAITGLLNDFQYAWLIRFEIPYKFRMLDIARSLCNGENKVVFKATGCKSIEEIRHRFSEYIEIWHYDDDRVILALHFDGKSINAKWLEMKDYLKSCRAQ